LLALVVSRCALVLGVLGLCVVGVDVDGVCGLDEDAPWAATKVDAKAMLASELTIVRFIA
jgi:hypothetical protein